MRKYYAVAAGKQTGIFGTWDVCSKQVKGYSGAIFKSFKTQSDAQAFLNQHGGISSSASQCPQPVKVKVESSASKKRYTRQSKEKVNDDRHNSKKRKTTTSTPTPPAPSNARQQINADDSASVIINLSIHVTFDGGSRGNPGLSGCGAGVRICTTIVKNGLHRQVEYDYHLRNYVGARFTNNQAEYSGIIVALKFILTYVQQLRDCSNCYIECSTCNGTKVGYVYKHGSYGLGYYKDTTATSKDDGDKNDVTRIRITNLSIHGDSNLIIQQLKGVYKCSAVKIVSYYETTKQLLQQVLSTNHESSSSSPTKSSSTTTVELKHIYRKENKIADALANDAMDTKQSWYTCHVGFDNHILSKKAVIVIH